MIGGSDAQRRLRAAHALLLDPTTTREKFNSVRTLIQGLNPTLDQSLSRIENHFATWDKVQSGDVIMLSAEHLPENTEEEKKRKKWLLFFINSWRQLKGEVGRVQAEVEAAQEAQGVGEKVSHWGRILGGVKGPLGILTVAAAAGIFALQSTSVTIMIENQGCGTMRPFGSAAFSIPGIALPEEPIPSGGRAEAKIPGFPVKVDGQQAGFVTLNFLNYSLAFNLPSNIRDVTLNGESLLGKVSTVKLSEREQHTLVLMCA